MIGKWIKNHLPRSFSGRAALIILVPIVTIQLVVSIMFIQRHFERVTVQMTDNIVFEFTYLVAQVNEAENIEDARKIAAELGQSLSLDTELPTQSKALTLHSFDDFSGRVIIRVLNAGLPNVEGVDLLTIPGAVQLWVGTHYGVMRVRFARSRVATTNPHQLLVLMIFTSILMTAIAFLFMRNQIRPIKRLAVAAEAFGKGRTMPYTPSGATEIRAAGGAFLAMRARIERHIEQRTLMLSGVSHDLRTPLTRFKLGLSMMDESDEVRALRHDVEDMTRLLDEFLDFAKGEAEDRMVRCEPMDIVRKAIQSAKLRGIDLRLAQDKNIGLMSMRPTSLMRALDNLLGNAARYAKHGLVTVFYTPSTLTITVEDDGPGIPVEEREEALLPFSRLEPGRNQNKGSGVGLGLAITVDIARAHGGSLVLEDSTELGGLKAVLVFAR